MKKSIHLIICFLLLFSGTIGGQNDYFLTSIDNRLTTNNDLAYIDIDVEIVFEWEVTYTLSNEKKSTIPTVSNNTTASYNNIKTIPSFDIKSAILSKKIGQKTSPVHTLQRQFPSFVSVVPKQVIQPITITKRPKSFGALYAF